MVDSYRQLTAFVVAGVSIFGVSAWFAASLVGMSARFNTLGTSIASLAQAEASNAELIRSIGESIDKQTTMNSLLELRMMRAEDILKNRFGDEAKRGTLDILLDGYDARLDKLEDANGG